MQKRSFQEESEKQTTSHSDHPFDQSDPVPAFQPPALQLTAGPAESTEMESESPLQLQGGGDGFLALPPPPTSPASGEAGPIQRTVAVGNQVYNSVADIATAMGDTDHGWDDRWAPQAAVFVQENRSFDSLDELAATFEVYVEDEIRAHNPELNDGEEESDEMVADMVASPAAYGDFLRDKLMEIRAIAAAVTPSNGMDCDRWAEDFQTALEEANIPFTPIKLLIRPNRQRNAIASGARIEFGGELIGHDSHFWTEVRVGPQIWTFDNINPEGMLKNTHFGQMTFFLEDPNANDKWADPVEVDFAQHVIMSRELAAASR